MTLTEMRKLARRARHNGYYISGATSRGWVPCPLCRAHVHFAITPWGESVTAQVDDAVVNHLRDACGQAGGLS